MDLVVLDLPGVGAAEIGLTEAALQAAVESRLRSARLYDADAGSYLYVNVNVVEKVFGLNLGYRKFVYDQVAGESGFATTWDIGQHRQGWGDRRGVHSVHYRRPYGPLPSRVSARE